jgi:membrane dipeptidase
MCLCGMMLTRRQWLGMALAASAGTLFPHRPARADEVSQTVSQTARDILRDTLTVDTHSHARGMVFGRGMDDSLSTGMRAGQLSAVCLAEVPDQTVIGPVASGGLGMVRTPAPGDLYKYHLERLDWMDRLAQGNGMRRATTVAELRDAKAKGEPAFIQDIEGCDFLDGRLERLKEAHDRGARVIQLVHYIRNDIGDYQTGPVIHNGLSAFGVDVIRELQRLGVVVDMAHGTEAMVKQAVGAATRPLLLSHTLLRNPATPPGSPLAARQVSPDHARMIADTGGVVGVWHFFSSMRQYVDGIRAMVDVVGVDHVCIGTDQQVAKGLIHDYANYPALVDEMLKAGFRPDEAAKILGGNFMRVFSQATGTG